MTQEIILAKDQEATTAISPGQVQSDLDRNPAAVYLSTLRPSGRRSMQHHLNTIARMLSGGREDAFSLAWQELRYQHTAAVRTKLEESHYKPSTANTALKALRGVLKQAWKLGLMEAEDYRRAADVKLIKSETLPRGRALLRGEIIAILDTCAADTGPAGARDAAIFAVLYAAGLRRSEVVKLTLADYDHESGALTIRAGKGNKDRVVYLGADGAGQALEDWLTLRGTESGLLFCPVNKAGRIVLGQTMTDQAVLKLLKKRATQAGVRAFSPHDLRRTFISDLLDAGADIVTVQKLAGHADVSTTARYDRRGEVAKRKAASLLHVPYRGRQQKN
ncbi:MAG TPA: tyrosine-type recombinase/integrase [Chloroflexia bacterium]|nr:tyrosine-type recombinase/integrase [Chloroflexia bacterium]